MEFHLLERPELSGRIRRRIPGLRLHRCDGHLLAISSTELREQAVTTCRSTISPRPSFYIKQHSLCSRSAMKSKTAAQAAVAPLYCSARRKKAGDLTVLDVSGGRRSYLVICGGGLRRRICAPCGMEGWRKRSMPPVSIWSGWRPPRKQLAGHRCFRRDGAPVFSPRRASAMDWDGSGAMPSGFGDRY